ncbi:MAG: FAD-dependent oxidoreductase [Rhodopirellula sp.]|nr:FAD-dependent oxidoreductase [Rhodopirellula sp.]
MSGSERRFVSSAAGFSHIASGAVRLQRTVMTLEQAAGNAAAIASKHHVGVGQVDIAELQARLKEQRVDITAPPEQALP